MKRAESHQLKNSVQERNRQKKKNLMMRACKGERERENVIKYNFLLQLFCYHARPLFCKLQYQQELKQQNYILTKKKKKKTKNLFTNQLNIFKIQPTTFKEHNLILIVLTSMNSMVLMTSELCRNRIWGRNLKENYSFTMKEL